MKLYKLIIAFAIVFGLPCALLVVARLTGGLQYYTVPTSGMRPNIEPGDVLFATNLREPKMFDLAVHKSRTWTGMKEVIVQRVCGMPGDTVEIVDGAWQVYGQPVDDTMDLCKHWIGPSTLGSQVQRNDGCALTSGIGSDSITFCAWEPIVRSWPGVRRWSYPRSHADTAIFDPRNLGWNQDQYGPLVVPKDSLFLLGDYRNQSWDSRYLGFIPMDAVVGLALDQHLRA